MARTRSGLTSAGVTTEASFALTNTAGAANSIVVNAGTFQAATVATAFTTPLSARVTDGQGNPVVGATVTFDGPTTGARATFSASTATTNSSGIASVTATAGAIAGNYTVGAATAGVTTEAMFALTNLVGQAVNLTVSSGSNQTAAVGEAFAAGLVARVTDAQGNGVAGTVVTFAAPTAGAFAALSARCQSRPVRTGRRPSPPLPTRSLAATPCRPPRAPCRPPSH